MKAKRSLRHRIFSMDYERLFAQMIGVSVAAHIIAAIAFIILPSLLPDDAQAQSEVLDVELTTQLPKGPGLGPRAPDITQAAIRTSDARKMQDIMKERENQDPDAVKLTKKRDVHTNRLGWQDKQRMEAIEKLREKKSAQDTYGGGGDGNVSTSGILNEYIILVRSRITSAWSLPAGLPSDYLETKVYVRIYLSPTGKVLNKVISKPSNFEPLDRSCLSAIAKAELPPPPGLLVDKVKSEGILIVFHPKVKKSF